MPRRPLPTTPKKYRQQTLHGYVQSSSSPLAPSPKKAPSKTRKRVDISSSPTLATSDNGASESEDVGAIHFEPQVVDLSTDHSSSDHRGDEDEDDDDYFRRAPPLRFKREVSLSSEDELDILPSRAKGKGRLRRRSDDSGSDNSPVSPKKPRLAKRDQDSDGDDGDLMDEVDESRIIDARFRTRDKKSKFQENLDKLKRKKRGNAVAESSPSSQDEQESDEGSDIEVSFIEPFEGAKSDGGDGSQLAEIDSFIVEDAETDVVAALPAAFSMNTHQDLSHHFKIICQLFVHMAVRPAQERKAFMREVTSSEDSYFYTPLLLTRRKLSGLRDSLVASSVWRSGFRQSVERYPKLNLSGMEISVPGCDACHLGSRLSTILGRLDGLVYDRDTFEPLHETDDEDTDEEKPQKEFHLGRFCARRTGVFHRFSHWEYTLYNNLSREVEELRENGSGFVKVAYAGGILPPENANDADKIMDWLDQRGIIGMEWQTLKDMMNRARGLDAKAEEDED